MLKQLIITEKSTVTKAIVEATGFKTANGRAFGEFNGYQVTVTSARGHLLRSRTPDEISPELGWNNPKALTPIPRNFGYVPTEEEGVEYKRSLKYLLDIIGEEIKKADEVVIGTDADREGEFIGWLILNHFGWKGPTKRLWLGEGVDPKSMDKAMRNLLPYSEKRPLAYAAEARSKCDSAYMYLVRLLTFYGKRGVIGESLGVGAGREGVVSVGRVQTAALYMIYVREMELRNFVPKDFFNINGLFSLANGSITAEYSPEVTAAIIESCPMGVTWEPQGNPGDNKPDRPLFTGVAEVEAFHKRLMQAASQAKVRAYNEGKKQQRPPITYELVKAKAELSKLTKMSGDLAQVVIEDLYEQGFVSYPRTAQAELPMSAYEPDQRNPRLDVAANIPHLAAAAKRAIAIHDGKDSDYQPFLPKVFVTKKLEHEGLTPTPKKADINSFKPLKQAKGGKIHHTSEQMRVAYTLICESYVRAMLPPAQLATQKIELSVPVTDLLGHPEAVFSATAERIIDPGWLAILPPKEEKGSNTLPVVRENSSAPLKEVVLKKSKTKSPPRYTSSNFEVAMANAAREVNDPILRKYMADNSNKPAGIGTPATRQNIVPTLKARGYISTDVKGYHLEAKGEQLINYLVKSGHHWAYRIDTTAEWEGKLTDLANSSDGPECLRLQGEFIEGTFTLLEEFIDSMNEKYSQAAAEAPRRSLVVTDRMKAIIKDIAKRKGLSLPKGILTDPAMASEFLNTHLPKKKPVAEDGKGGEAPADASAPSPAQLSFLAKVEASLGIKASDDVRSDKRKLSDFLSKAQAKIDKRPPSEKMIALAKRIADKLPEKEKPKEVVFAEFEACRQFINKHAGK